MDQTEKQLHSVVFALPGFEHVRDAFCRRAGYLPGKLIEEPFPNGELARRFESPIPLKDAAAVIIGSTDDRHLLSYLDFARGIGAESRALQLVVPFYRYSTQERARRPAEIVTAKTRAELLSGIPASREGNSIFLFDLHSPRIVDFFDPQRVAVNHLSLEQEIARVIDSRVIGDGRASEIVVASPDDGRREEVRRLSRWLGCDAAFVRKERLSGSETRTIGEVEGDVAGKVVVIYDDMIRSGTTAIGAAEKYRAAGATKIWLVATHADFAPGAIDRLGATDLFSGIAVTDSWSTARSVRHPLLHIEPIGEAIAREISQLTYGRNMTTEPTIETPKKEKLRVLIIVDPQNDFCPGGSLAVPEGDQIMAEANRLIREGGYDLVVATQDYHPQNHVSFAANHPGKDVFEQIELDGKPQTLWPGHCVPGTPGAEFHPELTLPADARIVQKGTDPQVDSYSGFFDNNHARETELRSILEAEAAKHGLSASDLELTVVGLALDYCVKFTALDAQALGYQTEVAVNVTRAVNLAAGDDVASLRELAGAGVNLVTSEQVIERSRGRELPLHRAGRAVDLQPRV